MTHLDQNPLDILIDRRPDATVVTLRGELDLATAPRLGRALDEIGPGADVVLDLGPLSHLDSTGVRLLLERDLDARAHGRRLTLRPGIPAVQRLFELTDTDGRLRFAA